MTKYTVSVIGTTWGGGRGTYQQSFNDFPDDVPSSFGDFETVDDWQITKTNTETKQLNLRAIQTISTTTLLVDWNNDENRFAFLRHLRI